MGSPAEYIVAIRRVSRSSVPDDWQERVRRTPGVRDLGASERRMQIEADEGAVGRVRESLGEGRHVEPVVPHNPLAEQGRRRADDPGRGRGG